MTTHAGCALDFPDDAVAYANYRGHRLVLADVLDDPDGVAAVLDEIGDCAACYRHMSEYLAGLAGSLSVGLAENAGADREAAIQQWEIGLAKATSSLPSS